MPISVGENSATECVSGPEQITVHTVPYHTEEVLEVGPTWAGVEPAVDCVVKDCSCLGVPVVAKVLPLDSSFEVL